MCGRYRAKSTPSEVEKLWKVPSNEAADSTFERIEVAPTTSVAVLAANGDGDAMRLEAVRWGIQPEWSKRPLLNARSDKLASGRTWKHLAADHTHRVLFVADGWYEWLRAEKKQKGAPPFLHLVDGGKLFAMAGLLDVAHVKDETMTAATIVTTDAAGAAAELHNRMPVVFPDLERQRAWLNPDLRLEDLDELLVPLADGVTTEPVTLPSSAR